MTIPEMKSDIVMPEGVNANREAYLIVVAKGPDVKRVEVGDRVVTLKGTVVGVPLEGKTQYMAKEEFIMGVIADE